VYVVGVKRPVVDGVSPGEELLEPLGSYTVAGRKDSEGSRGGTVADDDGGRYAGERGLARRWGLEAGEWEGWALAWVRVGEGAGREGESGCSATPLNGGADVDRAAVWRELLLPVAGDLLVVGVVVAWDLRLKGPAEDRRRVSGAVEFGSAASLSESERRIVREEELESELRRLADAGSSVG
jgi:hypothetical protein